MSTEYSFSKENLDACFKELGKEFRRLNGTKMPAELILIGGASVLVNYGFREMTTDVDAIILASSAMKEAVNRVGGKLGLPHNWLNTDFKKTSSYSDKLTGVSVYYRTFSNVLTIRTVASEYLIAMKLMSGRQYKHDFSDVAGILSEHGKRGTPITKNDIEKAVVELYTQPLPEISKRLLDDIFNSGNYERVYEEMRELEKQNKEVLLNFNEEYPGVLNEANTNIIIEQARRKKEQQNKESE